ncbi:hypothetical protein ACF09Y_09420 [Streptomyces massasporeus]|uniref:hypothetical protein n=1 Tax=Streptomyces massasporeus TaxID=67324 RepID=UPI0036FE8FAB
MADEETDLHRAARLVVPYLDELIGERTPLELRDGLPLADDNAIRRLAATEPVVGEWLADYLDATESGLRTYNPLSGDSELVAPSAVFRCPQGTLIWYRRFVGEQPPRCPRHGVNLIRIDEGIPNS